MYPFHAIPNVDLPALSRYSVPGREACSYHRQQLSKGCPKLSTLLLIG
jgi:hypothetical protein